MTPNEYIKNVLVTESRDMGPLQERFSQIRSIRLLHGAIGLASELAEIRNMAAAHPEDIDEVNLKEEMGDLCWYMGIMTHELNINPDEIFRTRPIMAPVANKDIRKLHLDEYVDGMTIDIGEMIDLLKKNLMYGKTLNEDGIKEKLFSLSCMIESALNAYGMNSEMACERNIEKLRARYGEKFTEAAALERNLALEREILEKN